jgi:hypothetical protein
MKVLTMQNPEMALQSVQSASQLRISMVVM